MAREIKRITQELNFDNYILFNDSSMFRGCYYKELLDPKLYIYYIRDNFIAQKYFRKHGPRLEKKMIETAEKMKDFINTKNIEGIDALKIDVKLLILIGKNNFYLILR